MKKIISQRRYIHLLEEYYQISESKKTNYGELRLSELASTINEYKEKKDIRHQIISYLLTLGVQLVVSFNMAMAIIWCLNEILSVSVAFTLNNILIVSLLFFVGKARLELFSRM